MSRLVVETVVDGVQRIRGSGVNAYFVETGEGPVLVDAATRFDVDDLREALAAGGWEPADLVRVLVTHHDPDHVGGLGALLEEVDVPVHMHARDAAAFTGDDPLPLTRWKGLMQKVGGLLVPEAAVAVETVADGDRIGGFRAYHTPGHTPGHLAFLDEDRGVLFAGDLLWAPFGAPRFMPGVMDDDPDLSTASLGSLAHRVPPLEAVAPGHGRPVTDEPNAALKRLASEA